MTAGHADIVVAAQLEVSPDLTFYQQDAYEISVISTHARA